MPEKQEDVDALLAEVSALADEAVADIGGEAPDESGGPDPASPSPADPIDTATSLAAGRPAGAVPTETPRSSGPDAGPVPGPPFQATPAAPRRSHAAVPSSPIAARAAGSPHRREDPSRILSLEVPVIVQLAERTMPLRDIITLSTGAIIEFDKPADSLLDLMINNKCVGRGQAVKVGENFGLRVGDIGSVRERIRAMGES